MSALDDDRELPEFTGGYHNDLSEEELALADEVWDRLDAEWRAEEEAAAKAAADKPPTPAQSPPQQ